MLKRFCTILAAVLAPGWALAQAPAQGAQAVGNDPAAKVACKTGGQFFWACHPISETPEGQGIGAAAARLAACMFVPRGAGSTSTDVVVPFQFDSLTFQQVIARDDCPYDPEAPPELPGARPSYQYTPTAREFQKNYPPKAQDFGKEGVVVLECAAIDNRYHKCRVLREGPMYLGFAEAALRISALMQLAPLDKEGKPVEGRLFRFTIAFKLPQR
jgi:hypothetical protein